MNKLTAIQFRQAVDLDPAWATTLTEPIEITDYCDMAGSGITHLSNLLSFTARDEKGRSADFSRCPNIIVAQGTF